MSDEQLVKKCLEKDTLAQKHLFDVYSKKMMGVCLRYAKDSDEAQDVLQIGFIKVFEKLDTYKREGSLEGWIRKIIVNTALDIIRKNKKFMNDVEMEKVDYQLQNYNEDAVDVLSVQDLLSVIQKMPTGFKTVFNMYVIEGYSHQEIADELNISVNTSKSQLSRARAHLQKVLIKEKVI
ncbi:MAG: RNA polymerase subunit sigma-70 [Flavobacteriales bacterium CG_4_10_14_0_2_um_filter_32_8]|nr:MAG: RNA polymerase subunit sigma-70 [Flavobacteriales bacterium CG_4_10_14_0_2_um_filter_32_8]PJB14506.1 MAG: RNA polymerase subunit sigma-70 [Flavobacteriales bacterium CG_4_9_14_3_um_filter_32_8]